MKPHYFSNYRLYFRPISKITLKSSLHQHKFHLFRKNGSIPFGHKKRVTISCNPFIFGAGDRSRTYDLLITSQLLYQLSYTSEGAYINVSYNYLQSLSVNFTLDLFCIQNSIPYYRCDQHLIVIHWE